MTWWAVLESVGNVTHPKCTELLHVAPLTVKAFEGSRWWRFRHSHLRFMSHPPFWEETWNDAQPRLRDIQAALKAFRSAVGRIPRIGQLDAELLDEELAVVLQEPVVRSIEAIQTEWKGFFYLELGLLIRLILYKFSVWDTGATYGARLQGLKLVDAGSGRYFHPPSRRKLVLHAVLTIGLPYLHGKYRAYALSRSWSEAPTSDLRRRFWEALMTVESFHSALGLIGFVVFLWDGRYRTLLDRALGLRLVPARVISRSVSYEFMNRQMVWHAFTEFLLFLIPLVNVSSLRRRLRSWLLSLNDSLWLPHCVATILGLVSRPSEGQQDRHKPKGPFWALPDSECAICVEKEQLPNLTYPLANSLTVATSVSGSSGPAHPIQTAYVTSCGHVYCYVCLTERMAGAAENGQEGWSCLRCAETVRSATRVKAVEEEDDIDGSDTAENDGDISNED